jgi:hypothetical protein
VLRVPFSRSEISEKEIWLGAKLQERRGAQISIPGEEPVRRKSPWREEFNPSCEFSVVRFIGISSTSPFISDFLWVIFFSLPSTSRCAPRSGWKRGAVENFNFPGANGKLAFTKRESDDCCSQVRKSWSCAPLFSLGRNCCGPLCEPQRPGQF